jgi:hypothetical protein
MGIRYLNKFIMDNCSNQAIRKTTFAEFKHKTIVIDASIYLYKFIGINALCENLYLMISIFIHYKIHPIFIFDGKPPVEKRELLNQRSTKKKEAEDKYNVLRESLTEVKEKEKVIEIEEKMDYLKKQFVRIKESDKDIAKQLLTAYGVKYIDAHGEADELCVNMVMKGKAWACISDDMDMFVYGCKRVIRQVSLMNHTCTFYNIDIILRDLDMSMEIFRQIMVISGTDYNIHENTSLHETIKWYYEYQKYMNKLITDKKYGNASSSSSGNPTISFYDWLLYNTKYIQNYDKLMGIYSMFILDANHMPNIEIKNVGTKKNKEELAKILEREGFIFV